MLAPRNPRQQRRTARPFRTLACILAAATLGACAPAGRLEQAPSPATSRVIVRNYSWDRVTLYLARNGVTAFRLGDLDAFSDRTFSVPRWALADINDVYFVGRKLAGRSFRSESFIFPTGATAVWTIENHTAISHVMLR